MLTTPDFHDYTLRNLALLALLLSALVTIFITLVQKRKARANGDVQMASPNWFVALLVLFLFSAIWIVIVDKKSHTDAQEVLHTYREESGNDADNVREKVHNTLDTVYQNLRTIASLPSVRNLESAAPAIDSDAHESIQQIYNSLREKVSVSEVYIVQADLDPDAIDPRTKKPAEPYFMFDGLIGGHSEKEMRGIEEDETEKKSDELEEVEIYEYRALRQQMAWLKEHYPTQTSFKRLHPPLLSSNLLITCDNSYFKTSRDDADRTGIIFSVPFYNLEGQLRGTITAVVLKNALQDALPAQNYALINSENGYVIPSRKEGRQTVSDEWVRAAKPDPSLLYSDVLTIGTDEDYGKWKLWVGLNNSSFLNSEVLESVQQFELAGYVFALCFNWFGIFIWFLLRRGFALMQSRNRELDERLKLEKAQRNAIAAMEAAERSASTKSEFLANMSHELRTPLNSILGMLRLLKNSPLNRAQETLVDTSFRSSTNLLEIINDILDLSKIDAGAMQLERIGFDPAYVLQSAAETIEQLSKEKNIPLTVKASETQMPYVLGDPSRMGRIFINLMSNAIKYTDRGHVEVFARCTPIDDKYTTFRLEVKDTGIGIPENKISAIFEKFTQADSSTTRKYGGTGLGLAITRELVEMMGGKIGVNSKVGEGSTFWVSIPFEITQALHQEKQIRQQNMFSGIIPPDEVRILIAEDHPMNQLFMKKVMQNFGITHYKIVPNGVAALKAYDEKPWDVILMDCHMPEKNGYDTTEEIRNREKTTGKHVPIIAMTANAMVGDKEKCLRYGMDEYLSKPVDLDVLQQMLGQWIRFEAMADAAQAEPIEPLPAAEEAFDLAQLKSLTGGDRDIEKELIEAFVTQSNENIAGLRASLIAPGDAQSWKETAHMLKGGAAGLGAAKLHELCEIAQHFSGNLDEKQAIFAQILSEYERIKAALAQMGY